MRCSLQASGQVIFSRALGCRPTGGNETLAFRRNLQGRSGFVLVQEPALRRYSSGRYGQQVRSASVFHPPGGAERRTSVRRLNGVSRLRGALALWCGLVTAPLVGGFMKWTGRETGPQLGERSQDHARPFSPPPSRSSRHRQGPFTFFGSVGARRPRNGSLSSSSSGRSRTGCPR